MVFILLLILLIILAIMLFNIALKIVFTFDTDKSFMNVNFYWAYPFVKGNIKMVNNKPILTVYIFNIKLYEKAIKAKKGKLSGIELYKSVKFEAINITANYGFENVFSTGIACAVISFLLQFIEISSISQNMDFLAGHDYIYLKADAHVNIGITLIQLIKINYQKEKNYGKQYGFER